MQTVLLPIKLASEVNRACVVQSLSYGLMLPYFFRTTDPTPFFVFRDSLAFVILVFWLDLPDTSTCDEIS
jgi:hypothetical protein